jgi:DNA repair protein RadC
VSEQEADSRASESTYVPRIRDIPAEERPRERLRDFGASNLQTAELLAIILRTGSDKQSALSMASSLLARHGGLGGLARLSFDDLMNEHGVGPAKAAEIQALFQLAIRYRKLETEDRLFVRTPMELHALLGDEMALFDQEHLRVVLLNTRNQVMAIREVYIGTVNSAQVRIAEVLREAIRQNAPNFILVHNHPSGDPLPSSDDVAMTKQMAAAAKQMEIELLDHVIIGDRRFASLKQMGLMA